MMKPRLFFWTSGLLAVLLISSCASAETISPVPPTTESIPASAIPVEIPPSDATAAPTQVVDVQAVPTSRGPDLHATDPSTVRLTSGGLQLVEFFRFT